MRGLVWLALVPLLGAQPKAVSLSSPIAETVYALGAQDRLLGVSTACVFPAQILADRQAGRLREVGSFMKPDLDAVVALKPEVVFTSHGFQRKLAQQLRARGLRVEHFEPHSLEDVFANIERVGEALERGEQARALTAGYRRELAEIRARTAKLPKVRVYLEVNHEGPWTTGARTPLEDLIRAAGGQNIFAGRDEGVFVTTHEEIVLRDPEVILSPIWREAKVGGIDGIVPLAEIAARPGYGATAAVRNSRVLYYDSALFKHEGPRQVLAIRKLAYLLHPEAFENPPGTIPVGVGENQTMSRVLTQVLAQRFDEDLALIEEMLTKVPEGRETWRPDWPKSPGGDPAFTVAELAAHFLMSWGGVNGCLQKLHPEKLKHLDAWKQQVAQNKSPKLAVSRGLLASARAHTKEGFALTVDADLSRKIPTYFTPQGEVFLETLLTNGKHVNHHAYQLFVYLKLSGLPVGTQDLYRFKSRR